MFASLTCDIFLLRLRAKKKKAKIRRRACLPTPLITQAHHISGEPDPLITPSVFCLMNKPPPRFLCTHSSAKKKQKNEHSPFSSFPPRSSVFALKFRSNSAHLSDCFFLTLPPIVRVSQLERDILTAALACMSCSFLQKDESAEISLTCLHGQRTYPDSNDLRVKAMQPSR